MDGVLSRTAPRLRAVSARVLAGLAAAIFLTACAAGPPPATPPIVPGTSGQPREINLIAKDYLFLPDVIDLVPGETVLLHVINGGLAVHEAIIGDMRVQDAWEVAEAATVGAPPGPTPLVSVPPDVAGVRIVVASGERVDLVWTVPADVNTAAEGGAAAWFIGCHIPGHWAKGMQVPVRWMTEPASPNVPTPEAPAS